MKRVLVPKWILTRMFVQIALKHRFHHVSELDAQQGVQARVLAAKTAPELAAYTTQVDQDQCA
jgi:hypothetical protein